MELSCAADHWICLTLTLVGGFGVWSVQAKITGAIISAGKIEVEQNRQVVQHQDGGVVLEIFATEGPGISEGRYLISVRWLRTKIGTCNRGKSTI